MIDNTDGVIADANDKKGNLKWDYSDFYPVATENLAIHTFREDMDDLDQLLNTESIEREEIVPTEAVILEPVVDEEDTTDRTIDKVDPKVKSRLDEYKKRCPR